MRLLCIFAVVVPLGFILLAIFGPEEVSTSAQHALLLYAFFMFVELARKLYNHLVVRFYGK
jgi:hypothetical protein